MVQDVNNNSARLSQKALYKVPFGTVSVTAEAKDLINRAIASNWLTRGKYVQEFEERFAALFGVRHAVAVSSGTDADAICCAALYDYGARRGDEIIVPASTFVATANSVLQAGFTPVFVDIQRETLNIDPGRIEAAVTPRTRAILPVHLMGKPAAMDEITAIAGRHSLRVIEDAAEAHGAEYRGRKVGSLGDMAAYSLYAAHIVTSIEGGMITTDDPQLAEAARSLRNHGITGKFEFRRAGFSAKMNELEAAVGLGNLRIFDRILEKRRRNLAFFIERFREFEEFFRTLKEEPHEKIGPHAFSIILKGTCRFSKDDFTRHLDSQGIDSRNLFYSIPTQCPSFAYLGHALGDFPEAEYCSDYGIHIGVHQDLEMDQLEYVVDVVRRFLESRG
jgi:dTDP-4-amino-4,6-dideoxygalactose transaminase